MDKQDERDKKISATEYTEGAEIFEEKVKVR
jgi:hypothetical protein